MISAKVIADSISNGVRITSLQLHLPKFILAQLGTHRCFSRSSASSRAIPTDKIIKMLDEDYFSPIYWGKNKAGMEANEALSLKEEQQAKLIWRKAFENAVKSVKELQLLGVHKQTINRLLEPFMWVDTICTATEWDNFFELRISEHAQPEMRALAEAMKEAMDNSKPVERDYHLPYIRQDEIDVEDPKFEDFLISSARCARVSYLKHDQTKPSRADDLALAKKLYEAGHFSPSEHQAVSLTRGIDGCGDKGFGKKDVKNYNLIRNFKGWVQLRAMLDSGYLTFKDL